MAIWHTDSARSAIRLALELEGLGDGEALLPAYLCDTLLAPFHERGLVLRFYDVYPDLSINLEDLSRRLGPRTRVLLFIHYFGFPQPEPVQRYLAGLASGRSPDGAGQTRTGAGPGRPIVIEDLTHAVWTEGLGLTGHYAVASYRKFGQPFDGGFLRRNDFGAGGRDAASSAGDVPHASDAAHAGDVPRIGDAPRAAAAPELESWASPAHCLSTLAWSLDREGAGGTLARNLWDQVELAYGRERRARAMAPGSARLHAGVDTTSLAARRRAAYEEVLMGVADCPFGSPLWPALPEGVCPLVLPMQAHSAAERGPMRAWLARRGLRSVLHWPLAPGIDPREFPGAGEAAARLTSVLLPLSEQENRAL